MIGKRPAATSLAPEGSGEADVPGILTPDQIETFQRDGLLILRDFYAPDQVVPIQRAIYNIIGLVIDKYRLDIERAPFAPERFDDGYQALIKANRKYGAEVYDAVKQIPAFVRLLGDPRHEQVVSELRPGALRRKRTRRGVAAAGAIHAPRGAAASRTH